MSPTKRWWFCEKSKHFLGDTGSNLQRVSSIVNGRMFDVARAVSWHPHCGNFEIEKK